MVNEAVEQGRGELLAAKDLDPFAESQVGRHDGGLALVAIRKQVEQQFSALLVERNEAQLIEDQEVDFLIAALKATQCKLATGLSEFPHYVGRPLERNPVLTLGSLHAQRERVSQAVWNLRTTCQPGGLGRYPQRSFRRVDYGAPLWGVGAALATAVLP